MIQSLFDERTTTSSPLVQRMIDNTIEGIGSGWESILSPFLRGESYKNIIEQLIIRAGKDGEKIYPQSKNIFRAFRESKYSTTNVVFIGQDPYHQPGIADGMAFSCGNSKLEQPSLKLIFDEIQRTTSNINRDPDLIRWANQGVLLLNTALTVKQFTPDSHTDLWQPFIYYLLKELDSKRKNLIYVFFGRKAQAYNHLVSVNSNYVYNITHPAAAAHRGGVWNSDDLFNKINRDLKVTNKTEIVW